MDQEKSTSTPKYLLYFCGLYIISLIVTAVTYHRLVLFHGIIEPGGVFVFPFMYFFGDLIAEVYGYAIAKKMIYVAFLSDAFFSLTTYYISSMPIPADFHVASAYSIVFKPLPGLFLISSISMCISAFVNIQLISRWKQMLNGRFFVMRSMGSSVIGEGVLSLISIPLIFFHKPWGVTIQLVLSIYLFKIVYTAFISVVGGFFVRILKRVENVDSLDSNENKNPLLSN